MSYQVIFMPVAEDRLLEMYNYIAEVSSPDTALEYVESVISHCMGLQNFPMRGRSRDDIRKGLRITNYRERTIIAYSVNEQERLVYILGVFYGGQDYESRLYE